MEKGLHFLAAIFAFLIWQFVIWPFIVRMTAKATQGTIAALRPAEPDSSVLFYKATVKAKNVLNAHYGEFLMLDGSDWDRLDACIHESIEAQMMVVAQSVTVLNIAVQDVAYDEERIDRLKILSGKSGFPKLKMSDDDWRRALSDLWSRFSVPTRMNLDMRYRYIYQKNLNSLNDQYAFAAMIHYAEHSLSNEFSFGMHRDTDWLGFVNNLATGNIDAARSFIEDAARSYIEAKSA